jgi:Kef-type K+ transport system membrane component KefB
LWLTVAGSALFVGLMVLVVRPGLARLEERFERRGRLSHDMMAVILLLVLLAGWTTEWLGIHALFGAFLAGAVMPKGRAMVHELVHRLEDTAVVLLLPIFFAFTGLRTSIGLVRGPEMWLYLALIILVAVAGKFGGSTVAARLTGTPWREAASLGVLMNTRGLMELVVLNIGLDIGILSPAVFAMMVMMALITTFMTSPVLEWIYFRRVRPPREYPVGASRLEVARPLEPEFSEFVE